jgi:hypothetical protein
MFLSVEKFSADIYRVRRLANSNLKLLKGNKIMATVKNQTSINVKNIVSQILQNDKTNQSLAYELVKAFPEFCETSPSKLPEQFGKDLKDAITLHYVNSVNTTLTGRYINLDGNYIKVNDTQFQEHKGEKIDMTVSFITNANIQTIRQGKSEKGKVITMPNPELANMLKAKKDEIAKYFYKQVKKLQDLAKLGDPAIHEVEGTKKARSANKDTLEFLADMFDKAERSIRTKEKNGMAYSDGKLFAVMAKEFLAGYKKNAKQ